MLLAGRIAVSLHLPIRNRAVLIHRSSYRLLVYPGWYSNDDKHRPRGKGPVEGGQFKLEIIAETGFIYSLLSEDVIVVNGESARYANGISKSQRTVTFVSSIISLSLSLSLSFFLLVHILPIYVPIFLFSQFFSPALSRPSTARLVTRRRIDTERERERERERGRESRYTGCWKSGGPGSPRFIYDFVDTEACTVDERREKSRSRSLAEDIMRGRTIARRAARSVARRPPFCGRKRFGRVCRTVITPRRVASRRPPPRAS